MAPVQVLMSLEIHNDSKQYLSTSYSYMWHIELKTNRSLMKIEYML